MFEKYNKVQRAVLETTLQLIMEKDLQATSMALISKQSGVSTGSIYYYFKSKEDIINELYRGIVEFNNEAIYRDFDANLSIQERFWGFWERVIHFNKDNHNAFQFLEQYSFSPYIDEAIKQEATQRSCGPLIKFYTEAIEQQLFIQLDPKLIVLMHFGSAAHVTKAYLANNKDELTNDIVNTVIQSCWNAVSILKTAV